jgi:hypothetical protein
MTIEANIYAKTKDGNPPELPDPLPSGFSVVPAGRCAPVGATHKIDQGCCYYSTHYERGPWPAIAAILMALHAAPNVEAVWYFGDSDYKETQITKEQVCEISMHYMKVGNRPYYHWGAA